MMLPTHAVAGLAVAAPLVVAAPDLAPVALAAALVGSVVPDLDLYAGHRRTLHYPSIYPLATIPVALGALILQAPVAVAATFLLVGAALHCRMDRYGGGLELRPWEAGSDRAVYDHVRGGWRTPKRWIRYDGAPEDLLIALVVGLPLLSVLDGPFQWVVAAVLLVGAVYAMLRRRLAELAPAVFGRAPSTVAGHVPERYLE